MSDDRQLRAALRKALAPFIDPDDDTMPAPDRVDGGFIWVAVDAVLNGLVRALHQPVGVVAAAEFGNPPDCAICGPNIWPCPTIEALDQERT
jgi:hypothetical protein